MRIDLAGDPTTELAGDEYLSRESLLFCFESTPSGKSLRVKMHATGGLGRTLNWVIWVAERWMSMGLDDGGVKYSPFIAINSRVQAITTGIFVFSCTFDSHV